LRLRRRLEPGHGTLIVLAVGALVLAAVYVITPTTALGPLNQPVLVIANTRYLMPAVVPAAALTAWAAGRLGRWGQLLAVALLAGVLESVRRDFGLHVYRDVALAAALVALAIAFRKPLGRLLRQPPALVGAVVIFIGAALSQQHRYSDRPYRADAVLGWVLDHDPSGHRIGLAGLWSDTLPPVLPVFGPRFGNTVSYVGPVARHVLEQYADAGSFAAALTRGRYDLLVVGRGRTPPEPVREETWARLAGYREIVHSSRLTLFTAS
jgi:hypothetical protein